MIVRSTGHVITDVPGVTEIRIHLDDYPEVQINYAEGRTANIYGPDALEELIKALQRALKLAREGS